jgi:cob(I)alamin adenosyltransferase
MAIKDLKEKDSLVVVYTGEGKGKTSASIGGLIRALGNREKVAFIQFIKYWRVSEHVAFRDISPTYADQLYVYVGGKGFYKAGELSEANVSEEQHKEAAKETYDEAYRCASSGEYGLVVCDEINNAVHDGLLSQKQLGELILKRDPNTSLILTGRDFPEDLLDLVDTATNMTKIKHSYDQGFIAKKGIDY